MRRRRGVRKQGKANNILRSRDRLDHELNIIARGVESAICIELRVSPSADFYVYLLMRALLTGVGQTT